MRISFGLTADWHIGSKHFLRKKLHEYLKILHEEGVTDVYQCGDILDGFGVYRGQLNDLKVWSFDDQTDMAAGELSEWDKKLVFYGVYGNHDYSFVKQNGADALRELEKKTNNYKFIGQFDRFGSMARRKIDGKVLEIVHGKTHGKTPGYPQESYLRERAKTNIIPIPDILGMGHLHRYDPVDCYGCKAFLVGNFQAPIEYTLRRGMVSPPGGYLIEINDGEVISRKILV